MAGIGINQSMGLTQSTILAPQLQQSLHILQAPLLELQTLVRQEIETNPVLEEVPPGEDFENNGDTGLRIDGPNGESPNSSDFEWEDGSNYGQMETDRLAEEFQQLTQLDEDWRAGERAIATSVSRGSDDDERRKFFFDSIPVGTTLQEFLSDQLRLEEVDDERRKIAEMLIGNINDAGYLTVSIEELSKSTGVCPESIEKVLRLIQAFDPAGVGARDLRESLLLQLERAGLADSLESKIVARHLDDLARHRYPKIARRLKVKVDQVQKAAQAIARLDPRPGNRHSPDTSRYVLPDASIVKVGGEFQILLNSEHLPHLRISRAYKEMMANDASGASDYLREKIRGGRFLIRSIQQRQQTLENICRVLLELQRDFFEQGPAFLKPLTMNAVAQRIGVHETTVSRAISGKFLATPFGVFEMRYFFTSGFEVGEGQSLSNTSVKETVAELIKNEDPHAPLSDSQIVEKLEAAGLRIARRTVAKYRDELGLLPSNLRRRY